VPRALVRWTGSLLIAASALGLFGFAYVAFAPESATPPWVQDIPITAPGAPRGTAAATDLTTRNGDTTREHSSRAITHLTLDRIGLDAEVVPARLVERNGATTWEVPAFKIGHAESTGDAGEPGNAVLLGHVTSVHSGNVFEHLDQAREGDLVQVQTDAERFLYRVVEIERVPRTDSQVLEQGSTPTISLITCTGMWLPTIWDFTERLVVRAELVDTP